MTGRLTGRAELVLVADDHGWPTDESVQHVRLSLIGVPAGATVALHLVGNGMIPSPLHDSIREALAEGVNVELVGSPAAVDQAFAIVSRREPWAVGL